jgi:PAS domain S-box-containing protein
MAFWPAALIALACAAALTLVGSLMQAQAQSQAEAQVRDALSAARARVDAITEATFSGTAVLETLLLVQGSLDSHSFDTTVALMRGGTTPLRNVVAAPNDVISMVHPLAPNARALGLDYRDVPAQWAQVQRARQLRAPMIFAPVKLVQGGLGVVQRRPVFLRQANGEDRYWGSLAAVADLERFVTQAKLSSGPVSFALLERRNDGQLGELIWGGADMARDRHLREDLQLPGAAWVLIGRPQGGWRQQGVIGAWLWVGLGVSLLLISLSAMLTRRRMQLHERRLVLEQEVAARRASQAEAEAAKSRLQDLLSTASDWLWEQDAALRLSYLSTPSQPDTPAETLALGLGKTRWEHPAVVAGQPPAAVWAAHRELLERHEPFRDFEYALRRANGSQAWIAVSGDPLHDADGRFIGYRGTGRDVSAVRGAEQALRSANAALSAAHDRLQAVLDAAVEVGIIATDASDRITVFNRGAERLLGYSPQEVLGDTPFRFHDATEMQARADELSQQLGEPVALREVFTRLPNIEGLESRRWTYVRRDGTRIPVSLSVSPMHDRQGALIGHLGVAVDLSTQQATQQVLEKTAQRLQAVMDSAEGVAIVAVGVEGRVEVFNRGAELMLGCKADQAIGHSPRRFHLPAELEAAAAALSARLGRPVAWHEVFERQAAGLDEGHTRLWTYVRADDGRHRRVSHTFSALRDAEGEINGYLAIALDVTEQQRAELAQQRSTARLQGVLDAASEVFVAMLDPAGRVVLFNRGAERLSGWRFDELIGQQPVRLFDQEELAQRATELSGQLQRLVKPNDLLRLQASAAPEQRTRLWTLVQKSGARLRLSLSLAEVRSSQGELLGHVSIGRDVTADLAHEQALRDTRDRLQAVLDASLDVGIIVIDMMGNVSLFNRGAERMFGAAQHEVLGRSTLMFHDPAELQRRADLLSAELGRKVHRHEVFTHPLETGGGSTLSQWVYARKGGERFPGALRFSYLKDRDGQINGYLAMTMDISAEVQANEALARLNHELEERVAARTAELTRTLSTLNQAQDELLRSERMAALGSLVAGVAHELNTPLGTCMTAASTLHERTRELRRDLDAQQLRRSALDAYARDGEQMAELLMRGLRNASDLVSHFKQLSVDQTSEHRRSFQLDTVVADVLTVMRPQLKHAQLRIETDIQMEAAIDGFPGELGRLLTNLIQNAQLHAFDADQPGLLRISARPLEAAQFELSVSDDGRGMSAEVRRRAFDPFFTTKLGKGGSGLGLNIVYNIATGVLGGDVELQSAPGQGSRFIFRLPLRAPQRAEPASAMQPTQPL